MAASYPDLLERLQHADTRDEAWREFLSRYSHLILKVLWRIFEDYDAVMESYTRVLYRLKRNDCALLLKYDPGRFDPPPRFTTYLVALVYRIGREYRSKAQGRSSEELQVSPAGIEHRVELHRLLERLPVNERQMLEWFYLEGRTAREIALLLDLPVRQVYYRLHRTMARLHDYVA